jgi:hypothetical protein
MKECEPGFMEEGDPPPEQPATSTPIAHSHSHHLITISTLRRQQGEILTNIDILTLFNLIMEFFGLRDRAIPLALQLALAHT